MKRQWKHILWTVAGAIGSTVVAAVLRRDDPAEIPLATNVAPSASAPSTMPTAAVRGKIVGLISDILAETYRKIQTEQREKRR